MVTEYRFSVQGPLHLHLLIAVIILTAVALPFLLICCLGLKEKVLMLVPGRENTMNIKRSPKLREQPALPNMPPAVVPFNVHMSQQDIEHNVSLETISFNSDTDMTGMKLHEYINLRSNAEPSKKLNNLIIPPIASFTHDERQPDKLVKGTRKYSKKRSDVVIDVPLTGDYATLMIPNKTD